MPRPSTIFAPDARSNLPLRVLATLLLCAPFAVRAEAPAAITATAEGTIAAPFAEVRETLLDIDQFGRWFPTVGTWRVLERTSSRIRVYGRHPAPWPVRDRDYVVDYGWQESAEGTLTVEAMAVGAHAQGAVEPVVDGVVRLDVLHSRWVATPAGDGTWVRYVVSFVPRGRLPRWVEKRSGLRDSDRLVQALEQEVARRGASGAR